MAIHNFESQYGRLPPGCSEDLLFAGGATPASDNRNLYAWGAFILPYSEQQNVYEILKGASSGDLEACFQQNDARAALQSHVLQFRCPSDTTAPRLNYGRSFKLASGEMAPVALSNYVAVNGSGDLLSGEAGNANGLFYWNSAVPLSSVTDGMGNTLMLGERAWIRERGTRYRGQAATLYGVRSVRERSFSGLADAMSGGRFRINFNALNQPDGLGESYVRRAFSSNHVRGAFFALADGSVRFISDDIDAGLDPKTQCALTSMVDSTFEQLLSHNDGQTIEGEF